MPNSMDHLLMPDGSRESLVRLARLGMTYALAADLGRFAHDLRSPLQALMMAGDALQDPSAADPEARGAVVRMLHQSTQRVENTLQSMQLPDLEDATPTPLSIVEVVDEVLGYWLLQRHLRSTRLQLEFAPGLPPVLMPRGILLHALLQLLLNAAEVVEQVGDGVVRITGEREGAFLLLRIGDSGPGLSDEARTHLFAPFWSDKSADAHLGVGLATSRGLLLHAGARLEMASSVPGETQFALYLPGILDD